jgi:uncharacterized protein (DUF1330 family)
MIVQSLITDEERYGSYRKAVVPLIEKFGGSHVRGGAVELLEGQQDDRRITAIRAALEGAGIEFLNGGSPGARIKPRKKIKHSDGAMKGYTTDPDEADRID